MIAGVIYGVLGTLFVMVVVLKVFPFAVSWLRAAMWKVRDGTEFVWAVFDTWLRQTDRRLGPKLTITRQARRRISRELAKRMV